jgi:hypothetical protein
VTESLRPVTPTFAASTRANQANDSKQSLIEYLNCWIGAKFKPNEPFDIYEHWGSPKDRVGPSLEKVRLNDKIREKVETLFKEAGWKVSYQTTRSYNWWKFTAPENLEYPDIW